jgi:acyl-CoA thioester hydrolase
MTRSRLPIPENFSFAVTLPVRITDINYGGHLGNDAVLGLLHEARIAFLAEAGYREMDVEGVGIIMTEALVQYRSEAFHGDMLRVEVAVTEIESHGCDILYRVTQNISGREVARARTSLAFFDYAQRKLSTVPPRFRQRYAGSLP